MPSPTAPGLVISGEYHAQPSLAFSMTVLRNQAPLCHHSRHDGGIENSSTASPSSEFLGRLHQIVPQKVSLTIQAVVSMAIASIEFLDQSSLPLAGKPEGKLFFK